MAFGTTCQVKKTLFEVRYQRAYTVYVTESTERKKHKSVVKTLESAFPLE